MQEQSKALHQAIYENNLSKIRELLKENSGLIEEWFNGYISIGSRKVHVWQHPVESALKAGHLEALKLLVEENNAKLDSYNICLHGIAWANKEIINYFNEKNIFSNVEYGITPLHIHAATGDSNRVSEIIAQNSGLIDEKDKWGRTPLSIAVSKGNNEIVNLLLNNNACFTYLNKNQQNLFYLLPDETTPELIALFRQKNLDINAKDSEGYTSLARAIQFGKLKLAKLLIAHDANPALLNNSQQNLFHLLPDEATNEWITLLLQKGLDINAKDSEGYTSLARAIQFGKLKLAKLLIAHDANPALLNNSQQNLFHLLPDEATNEWITLLLQKGLDINAEDSYGDTPLAQAIRSGKLKLAKLLIDRGANPALLNASDQNLFHLLPKETTDEWITLLLQKGLDINAKDYEGYTPLMRILESDSFKILRLLVDRGANPALLNNKNQNLFYGLYSNTTTAQYDEFITLFLQRGLDINAEDSEGYTPLARVLNNPDSMHDEIDDLAKVLLRYGACVPDSGSFECIDSDDNDECKLDEFILSCLSKRQIIIDFLNQHDWPRIKKLIQEENANYFIIISHKNSTNFLENLAIAACQFEAGNEALKEIEEIIKLCKGLIPQEVYNRYRETSVSYALESNRPHIAVLFMSLSEKVLRDLFINGTAEEVNLVKKVLKLAFANKLITDTHEVNIPYEVISKPLLPEPLTYLKDSCIEITPPSDDRKGLIHINLENCIEDIKRYYNGLINPQAKELTLAIKQHLQEIESEAKKILKFKIWPEFF